MSAAAEPLAEPRRAPAGPVVLDARVLCGSGGGPDKTLINSPRYLAPAGYRMLCAYLHHPDDRGFEQVRRRAEAKGAPVLSVPDHGPLDWRVVPRLLDICRKERVAVWHGHDYKTNALGLVLARFWPMRLVTTVHGWVHHTARTPVYYLIDRIALRYYEKVYCVSEDLYRACRTCGVPARRCELLENGIDLDDYRRRRTPAEAKRALGLPEGPLLIGAAGRLSAEKGFDVLVRAFALLLKGGVDARLVIIGEGDQAEPLRRLTAELGLGKRVLLPGYRSDLTDWYDAMDLFALSSFREGLPNVLLEAMAMEVPVVATRVNGVPRLVQDGANGLLVEPGSEAELAAALTRLARNPELRELFRHAGRLTVENKFSFAVRMDKLRESYDRLLGRPNRSGQATTTHRGRA